MEDQLSDTAFCAGAWQHIARLRAAIVEHPFNVALADGSLTHDRFSFYIVQDARYLVAFSQALSAAATRADDANDAAFLAGSAQEALIVERQLHDGYVEQLGLSDSVQEAIRTSPACDAYTSFLRANALTEPYPVVVAAVLPCFWIYHHVGRTILDQAGDLTGHPYQAWIETYADEEFADSVHKACGLADRLASRTTDSVRARMLEAFTRATEYEWLFWNSAWVKEEWPTARWLPN